MDISEQKLDRIMEILTPIADKVLAFHLGGSNALGFIENPRNYDVICVCSNREDCLLCARAIREIRRNDEEFRREAIDFRFVVESEEVDNLCRSFYPFFIRNRLYHRMDGTTYTRTITIAKFLSYWDEMKLVISDFADYMDDAARRHKAAELYDHSFYDKKAWYLIYLTYSFFSNGSWELSEEQKGNANLLHDIEENTFEQRKEIVKQLINDIKNCNK